MDYLREILNELPTINKLEETLVKLDKNNSTSKLITRLIELKRKVS